MPSRRSERREMQRIAKSLGGELCLGKRDNIYVFFDTARQRLEEDKPVPSQATEKAVQATVNGGTSVVACVLAK